MRVLLESTPQTTELVNTKQPLVCTADLVGIPARIWQGHVVEIDHAELRKQLLDICNSIAIVANEVKLNAIPADEMRQCAEHAREQLLQMAVMLDEATHGIKVHALVTRIAHSVDEPPHVADRFKRELQEHAPPRTELTNVYQLRMML